jgi:hypothetical protein
MSHVFFETRESTRVCRLKLTWLERNAHILMGASDELNNNAAFMIRATVNNAISFRWYASDRFQIVWSQNPKV